MKPWILRSLIVGVLLVMVGVASTFYFLGPIVKKGVQSAGPNITKTSVKLDSATISIFSGEGELKGFFVGNPQGFVSPFAVRARSIKIGMQPGSVFSDKVIVRLVKVEAPEITFEGTLAGNNLTKILANIRGNEQESPEATSRKKLQLDDFIVTGGKIHLTTSLLGGKSATLALPEIHLTNLGQGSDGVTAAELSERMFRVVVEETIKQVTQSSIGRSLSDFTKKIPEATTRPLDQVTRGLGNLLKKK